MALPKIVFHNVTNGLTAEIILSEEIDKNAIIEIPSDDTAGITDGSGNKLIKLTTHEQMKRLLNQMTADFNNLLSTMRRDLSAQFQNVSNAISNEASQRLEQDRNIMNSLNTEIQNRESADTQLQRNIDSEASTRQSKDNDLQRQLDEKVPVGTIIPVLKSLNGIKVNVPDYVNKNYLKCDGSLIPSDSKYSNLKNYLYPTFNEVSSVGGSNLLYHLESKDTPYSNFELYSTRGFSNQHSGGRTLFKTYQQALQSFLGSDYGKSFVMRTQQFINAIGYTGGLQNFYQNYDATDANMDSYKEFTNCSNVEIKINNDVYEVWNNGSKVGYIGESTTYNESWDALITVLKDGEMYDTFVISILNTSSHSGVSSTITSRYDSFVNLTNNSTLTTVYRYKFATPCTLRFYMGNITPSTNIYTDFSSNLFYSSRNSSFRIPNPKTTIRENTSLRDYLETKNVTKNCIFSLSDFNKLLNFDFIKMLSTFMIPIGHYISIRYRASTHSFSVYCKGINTDGDGTATDLYVTINDQDPLTSNGDDYRIDGVPGKDPNNLLDKPFACYIQFADLTTPRDEIIKEEVFVCFGEYRNATSTALKNLYPSYREIQHDGHGPSTFITSCNAMDGTGYLGVRCVIISLEETVDSFITNQVHGYMDNLIEIYATLGDYFTYVSGGNLINSSRLGRFSMDIGDFSRLVNIDETIFRNNFLAYGENLTFNMWRFRQWLGVRGDGKFMAHNYNEYYPFNSSTNNKFGNDTGGYDIGTQVREHQISLIRIYNCNTGQIEREIVYYSFDKTTDFDDGDHPVMRKLYPTFKFDDHPDEMGLHDSYDGSSAERICYVYRLPLSHLFVTTKRFKDSYKYENTSLGNGLDRKMLNMWRIKENYEASGNDTSISGIEYNPYGGVGRISMYSDDYKQFAWKLKTLTNSYGMKRYYINRLVDFNGKSLFFDSHPWSNSTRYQIRVNNNSYIDFYAYNGSWSPSNSSYRSGSLSCGYIYLVVIEALQADGTKNTNTTSLVIDFRNNGSTASIASNNSWCTGIIGRYYRNFKNPPYSTADYVLIDQSFSPGVELSCRIYRISSSSSNLFGYHCVEECNNEYSLPDLTNEDYVLGSGSSGQYINTGLILNKTYGDHNDPAKQHTPYHKNEILKILTVEFWIKF